MSKISVEKIATITGHRDCIYSLERSSVKNIVYAADGDGLVAEWNTLDPENGKVIVRAGASIYSLHYQASKNVLYIGENFNGIHKVDFDKKSEAGSAAITTKEIFDIKSIGNRIIAAAGDGQVTILAEEDLSVVAKLNYSAKSARSLSISPEGNELAVGYSDNTIRIFSLENYELIKELKAHDNSVFTVVYSPDGNYLLSGSRDAHLKIWNSKDYSLVKDIVAHMYTINNIAYSPSGKYFATCSMDKSIKIWDQQKLKLIKVIDKARHAGHGTSVNKLIWGPDGDYIISASDDRTLSVWDINLN